MRKICSVDGCEEVVKGHGLCRKHWERWRHHGHTDLLIREKGTGTFDERGYHESWDTKLKKQRRTCIMVAEELYGGPLPEEAVVHHKDGNRSNDAPENIVICANQAEHLRIHMEDRAEAACGNRTYKKCIECNQYDDASNMKGPYGASSTRLGHWRHRQKNRTCVNIDGSDR